jgi:hypothetical protein
MHPRFEGLTGAPARLAKAPLRSPLSAQVPSVRLSWAEVQGEGFAPRGLRRFPYRSGFEMNTEALVTRVPRELKASVVVIARASTSARSRAKSGMRSTPVH